jgi:hypothetical protein
MSARVAEDVSEQLRNAGVSPAVFYTTESASSTVEISPSTAGGGMPKEEYP